MPVYGNRINVHESGNQRDPSKNEILVSINLLNGAIRSTVLKNCKGYFDWAYIDCFLNIIGMELLH